MGKGYYQVELRSKRDQPTRIKYASEPEAPLSEIYYSPEEDVIHFNIGEEFRERAPQLLAHEIGHVHFKHGKDLVKLMQSKRSMEGKLKVAETADEPEKCIREEAQAIIWAYSKNQDKTELRRMVNELHKYGEEHGISPSRVNEIIFEAEEGIE